ncbi:MAG TPA: hypothetical protein VFJ85_17255 [Acidimicrobiales bacterium]|nr:hypothetical protein [Acidimicrobiales bacterium]
MSETGAMRDVPPDQDMPPGPMNDPEIITEQDDMPAGGMEEGE